MSNTIPPTATAQASVNAQTPVQAEVKALPPSLLQSNSPQTVKGEVTQVERDGTVRIATQKGEIQLKVEPTPQKGQVVELRITPPPKTPPTQQATIPQANARNEAPQPQGNPAQTNSSHATQAAQAASSKTDAALLPKVTVKPGVITTPPNLPQTASAQAQQGQTTSSQNLQAFANGPAKLLQTAASAVKTLLNPGATTNSTASSGAVTGNAGQASGSTSPLTTIQNAPQNVQTRPLTIGDNLRLLAPTPSQNTGLLSAPSGQTSTAQAIQTTLTPAFQGGAVNTATKAPHIDVRVIGIQSASALTGNTTGTTAKNHAANSLTIPAPTPPPGTAAPLPANAGLTPGSITQGNSFLAQVLGFTSQSLPVLSAALTQGQPSQTLILQFPTNNLQVGDLVRLAPTSQLAPNAQLAGQSPALGASLSLSTATTPPQGLGSLTAPQAQTPVFTGFSGDWPALDEALEQLLQTLPPEQASTLRQVIPQPMAGTPRLDAPAMLFIAALRNGDITNWLGDKNAQVLKDIGKSDVLSRLTRDMGLMGARANDAAPLPSAGGEWRSVSLPMLFGADLQRMQIFVQDQYDDGQQGDGAERKKDWLRFVMNADLSRIGALQLDGLYSEKSKSLDVLLRSHNTLGPDMRKTMRQHYTSLMEGLDMAGSLTFKSDPEEQWVQV